MALNPSTLQSELEQSWLSDSFPDAVLLSADRFASVVATWFSAAQAAGFPCSSAMARKADLMGQLVSALGAMSAAGAGQGMASALAVYMTGQVFGAGVASPPTGAAAAGAAFTATFLDVSNQTTNAMRAQRIAQACQAMAITTIVIFPPSTPPIPPSPVM